MRSLPNTSDGGRSATTVLMIALEIVSWSCIMR